MSGRLILVRHGQTHSNVARRLDTLPPGAELTELGHRQAREFADRVHEAPAVVLSSTAIRARQTAQYIADATGVPLTVRDGLQETYVGELEDRSHEDDHTRFGAVYRDWLDGALDSRVPAGESGAEVLSRYVPVLDELRASHLAHESATVYVVSHGAAIRLVAAVLADIDRDFASDNHLDNTGTVELVPAEGNSWKCIRWGDYTPPFESKGSRVPDDPMG
ncbi:MAG: histidine phosphatase family protein [Rhodococcus sp. (in: high G+C Gram-positive bacteria)]